MQQQQPLKHTNSVRRRTVDKSKVLQKINRRKCFFPFIEYMNIVKTQIKRQIRSLQDSTDLSRSCERFSRKHEKLDRKLIV